MKSRSLVHWVITAGANSIILNSVTLVSNLHEDDFAFF